MRKLFLSFLFVLLLGVLFACSSNEPYEEDPTDNQTILTDAVPQRKMIYTVNSSYDVTNILESVDTLKGLLAADEWFDYESIRSNSARFTVRVKTERLDVFTDALKANFQVRDFVKEGKDVSLQYLDKTAKITSINLQITRLQNLYASASLSEMITINTQMANLEVELMKLQGELNVFDSLIEYSEVHITLYGSTIVTRSPFINRFGNGFLNGFRAVFSVLDAIGIVIANLIPFALVFGPIGIGIHFGYKKYQVRKKLKKEKTEATKPKGE